jgi:hypothetical protein
MWGYNTTSKACEKNSCGIYSSEDECNSFTPKKCQKTPDHYPRCAGNSIHYDNTNLAEWQASSADWFAKNQKIKTPTDFININSGANHFLTLPSTNTFASSVDCICNDNDCVAFIIGSLMKSNEFSGIFGYQGWHTGRRGSLPWTHLHSYSTKINVIDGNVSLPTGNNNLRTSDAGIAVKRPTNGWTLESAGKIAKRICANRLQTDVQENVPL